MTDAQYHGCRGAEEMHEEFQTVLREHLARYPLMEPQDCAKLAYQSTFGPAHAAGERGDVLRQLLGECSALPADREARPPERIGNGLCRARLLLVTTHCAAFICRGRGIGRWLRRSWRICCF